LSTHDKKVEIMVADVPKKRRRHFLKEKDAKKFLHEVADKLGIDLEQLLGSKVHVELDEVESTEVFIVNGRPVIARSDGTLFPTLTFEEFFSTIPEVVVDMGAVPYVCKGADVMAPGIVAVKGVFEADNFLVVVDERHGKPLAIGVALFSSEAMKSTKRGKTVKILHYVGDKLWNYLKST
jgi:PUA-domain protein